MRRQAVKRGRSRNYGNGPPELLASEVETKTLFTR